MDNDQQVRLSFLEESGEYCEQIEQVLLELPRAESPAQLLDVAMRAAHSLKGGAGMMGFMPMAQVAHRLEDFFKIIRAQKVPVDDELQTLLLQGVDCFKDVRDALLAEEVVDDSWVTVHATPLFEKLRDRLGDLSEADEDRLLSEEEDVDLAALVFNSGIEESLTGFEATVTSLQGEPLRQAVIEQSNHLIDLGLMAELDAFVSLCQSVQRQIEQLPVQYLPSFAEQAMVAWRRTQSLVQLGRVGRLPSELSFTPTIVPEESSPAGGLLEATPPAGEGGAMAMAVETALSQAQSSQQLPEAEQSAAEQSAAEQPAVDVLQVDPSETLDLQDLAALQADIAQAAAAALALQGDAVELVDAAIDRPVPEKQQAVSEDGSEVSTSAESLADLDLSQLQNAIAAIDISPIAIPDDAVDQVVPVAPPRAPAAPEPPSVVPATKAAGKSSGSKASEGKSAGAEAPPARRKVKVSGLRRNATIRVAADDLQEINSLFGTLILERNAISLRQQQLDDSTILLQKRMQDLEAFNLRLRQWYDSSSTEMLAQPAATGQSSIAGSEGGEKIAAAVVVRPGQDKNSQDQGFDSLEMDQYSDLHLMTQEQMETIVQLQEVSSDIRLGLQEMAQATQSLNRTTRKLQSRITRTQMRPFSDIVSGFPRVIRDLSVQHGKQVELKIEGETALFERVALELLTDPIIHLLRNAFDHGLESETERLAAGKPAKGQITLRASQQGNRARIVIRDDGRGINLEKIRDRMRKHGVSDEHIAHMSEQELLSLIFDAGFSTAEKVTELSGRGVGMDVVRSNIEKLKGDIQVSTDEGHGTAFTITVPLTLSVLRVLLLEQQGMLFAIPVDAMEELLPLSSLAVSRIATGQQQLLWNDQKVPLVPLEERLTFNGSAALAPLDGRPVIDHAMAVVVRQGAAYYAVPVQRFWGEQEVATRPVASPMPLPMGFVGATVLGDGRVVPLVDLPALVAEHAEVTQKTGIQKTGAQKAVTRKAANLATETVASDPSSPASPLSEDGVLEDVSLEEEFTEGPTLTAAQSESEQTILVVDDSVHLRRYLTLTLEKAGYFVEQARDGQEAVDLLLGGLQVQAVLCDVEMPRLDGYGVLEEIKGRPEFKDLPISMLTSRNSEKHRKLAINLGASAYFSKPYNEQVLLKTLVELIGPAPM